MSAAIVLKDLALKENPVTILLRGGVELKLTTRRTVETFKGRPAARGHRAENAGSVPRGSIVATATRRSDGTAFPALKYRAKLTASLRDEGRGRRGSPALKYRAKLTPPLRGEEQPFFHTFYATIGGARIVVK